MQVVASKRFWFRATSVACTTPCGELPDLLFASTMLSLLPDAHKQAGVM